MTRFFILVLTTIITLSTLLSPVSAITIRDQEVVDRVVELIREKTDRYGDRYRRHAVESLQHLARKYPDHSRVQTVVPRIIFFVQNPLATEYPAGAGRPDFDDEDTVDDSTTDDANDEVDAKNTDSEEDTADEGSEDDEADTPQTDDETPEDENVSETGECGRGLVGSGDECMRSDPIVITVPDETRSLSFWEQDLYQFSLRSSEGYASLRRIVIEISGTIWGKPLDTANYDALGDATEFSNVFYNADDSTREISRFRLRVNGLDADAANGLRYFAVESRGRLFLVIDISRRIILDSSSTNFLLEAEIDSVSGGDSLTFGIPALSTTHRTGMPDEAWGTVSDQSPGHAGIVWSGQEAGDHSDNSADYFGDFRFPEQSAGYIGEPRTFSAR